MKTLFVDANVFLRFFTRDEARQHRIATELFRDAAAGKVSLVTGPPVLFETAWTLRSAYRLPRQDVLEVLSAIAALPGLRLTDGPLTEEAIALARQTGQEFADAYVAASAQAARVNAVGTFNRKHFAKMNVPLHDL